MKRAALGCVVLALCLVCCSASSQERFKGKGKLKGKGPAALSETYSGPRWEYSVLSRSQVTRLAGDDLQAGLNKLGEDGWELLAVEPAPAPGPVHLYFKRSKRAAQAPATGSDAAVAEGKEATHVIRLKHANAAEIAQTLTQLYQERRLRVAVDARTNSVIVAGPEGRLQELVKLAVELDGPDEARAVEKPKEDLKKGK